MDRAIILMIILCGGSFLFDVITGKYYILSLIEYGFYFVLLSAMLYNDIILPDINMVMLVTIFGITFTMYLIYSIYRLIKSVGNYKKARYTKEEEGDETVQWRKVS